MKSLFILSFLSIVFLTMNSCNTEVPDFYVHRENDFIMEAGSGTLETYFYVIHNIENNFLEEIESYGLNADQIESVFAGKGLYTSIFQEFDFDILWKTSVWLVSAEDPSFRKEIYYREQVPFNQNNELKLLSGLADLKEFLTTVEKYHLEIQLNFRNLVPANLEGRFTYSFAIYTY